MAVQWPTGKGPALRANLPDNKKGQPKPPWFLPTAAVLRDENAAAPGMAGAASANKGRVGDIPPCHSSDNSYFRAAPLVQERRPVLFVSFRFGPAYL